MSVSEASGAWSTWNGVGCKGEGEEIHQRPAYGIPSEEYSWPVPNPHNGLMGS